MREAGAGKRQYHDWPYPGHEMQAAIVLLLILALGVIYWLLNNYVEPPPPPTPPAWGLALKGIDQVEISPDQSKLYCITTTRELAIVDLQARTAEYFPLPVQGDRIYNRFLAKPGEYVFIVSRIYERDEEYLIAYSLAGELEWFVDTTKLVDVMQPDAAAGSAVAVFNNYDHPAMYAFDAQGRVAWLKTTESGFQLFSPYNMSSVDVLPGRGFTFICAERNVSNPAHGEGFELWQVNSVGELINSFPISIQRGYLSHVLVRDDNSLLMALVQGIEEDCWPRQFLVTSYSMDGQLEWTKDLGWMMDTRGNEKQSNIFLNRTEVCEVDRQGRTVWEWLFPHGIGGMVSSAISAGRELTIVQYFAQDKPCNWWQWLSRQVQRSSGPHFIKLQILDRQGQPCADPIIPGCNDVFPMFDGGQYLVTVEQSFFVRAYPLPVLASPTTLPASPTTP